MLSSAIIVFKYVIKQQKRSVVLYFKQKNQAIPGFTDRLIFISP
ncbi:MAG: hypothetical protein ACI89T_002617 [Cognaticolwellia sp.]|jgi:hypothetical protein